MKISTCTNKHFLRKIEVFIIFDSLLMYIDIHTKSYNFLKISMYSIRYSVIVHNCFKKSTFLTELQLFFPQNWQFCTKIDVEKNICYFTPKFARHDFITVLKNSLIWPKTNTFCIKWYFLPKGNNAIKNWHFSKKENTSLRKLTIFVTTRNYNFFENSDHLLEKWKYPSILVFLQDFRLYQWNTDNEKIEIKRIVIFFLNWQLNYF